MPAPTAEAGSTYLYLTWDLPGAPNGIITGYFLYQDGNMIYTGGQRTFNVTHDLQVSYTCQKQETLFFSENVVRILVLLSD